MSNSTEDKGLTFFGLLDHEGIIHVDRFSSDNMLCCLRSRVAVNYCLWLCIRENRKHDDDMRWGILSYHKSKVSIVSVHKSLSEALDMLKVTNRNLKSS